MICNNININTYDLKKVKEGHYFEPIKDKDLRLINMPAQEYIELTSHGKTIIVRLDDLKKAVDNLSNI
jgi:hypothetical protein